MKNVIVVIVLALLSDYIHSQAIEKPRADEQPSVGEVFTHVGSDTVMFYYNDRWQLVKPICATIFRVSRVDTINLTFIGAFTDYYSASRKKAVEGNYVNGKKEGRFNLYYPNGKISQTGSYVNDEKNGVWEYYYENGTKRQTLHFSHNEIIVYDFWDESGKRLVSSGNGEWSGFDSADKGTKTYGPVVNGRKNGTWKNVTVWDNRVANIEKYKEGKFLSGEMILGNGRTQTYQSPLFTFDDPSTFLKAEQFQIVRCFRTQAQKDYTINTMNVDRDTVTFIIKDYGGNLITGKVTPMVSKDSLLEFIASYDGIETPDGIYRQLYADVIRKFDRGTISFIVKNGQKYVYQYNDGSRDVLKNGSGLSKLFNEQLNGYTDRVFKDSILVSVYELFEGDTLYVLRTRKDLQEIIRKIDEVFQDSQFASAKSIDNSDMFFVVENNTLAYVIISTQNDNGSWSFKKVKMKGKNRHGFDHLRGKNAKYVVHLYNKPERWRD